jgi:hypothetical protein
LYSRDEYRRFAAECLALTHNMKTEQAHLLLVEMARVWMRLADEADLGPAPSTPDPARPAVQQQQQQLKSNRDGK